MPKGIVQLNPRYHVRHRNQISGNLARTGTFLYRKFGQLVLNRRVLEQARNPATPLLERL